MSVDLSMDYTAIISEDSILLKSQGVYLKEMGGLSRKER